MNPQRPGRWADYTNTEEAKPCGSKEQTLRSRERQRRGWDRKRTKIRIQNIWNEELKRKRDRSLGNWWKRETHSSDACVVLLEGTNEQTEKNRFVGSGWQYAYSWVNRLKLRPEHWWQKVTSISRYTKNNWELEIRLQEHLLRDEPSQVGFVFLHSKFSIANVSMNDILNPTAVCYEAV